MRSNPKAFKKHPQIRTSDSSTRGAGRQRKAWGGAQRNPQDNPGEEVEPTEWAAAVSLRGLMGVDDLFEMFAPRIPLSPVSRARN